MTYDPAWAPANEPVMFYAVFERREIEGEPQYTDDGNLIEDWAVCGTCHAHIHANPAESYANGWLKHREP